jgi:hypothetical protein
MHACMQMLAHSGNSCAAPRPTLRPPGWAGIGARGGPGCFFATLGGGGAARLCLLDGVQLDSVCTAAARARGCLLARARGRRVLAAGACLRSARPRGRSCSRPAHGRLDHLRSGQGNAVGRLGLQTSHPCAHRPHKRARRLSNEPGGAAARRRRDRSEQGADARGTRRAEKRKAARPLGKSSGRARKEYVRQKDGREGAGGTRAPMAARWRMSLRIKSSTSTPRRRTPHPEREHAGEHRVRGAHEV